MVSELAGEGAMPLPKPASHAEPQARLRRKIRRGSVLRSGVTKSKQDFLHAISSFNLLSLQINEDWSAVLVFQSSISQSRFVKILSKVLISFSFVIFNRSRSVNSSRVLDRVDAMFAVFDCDSWSRSSESLSAALVPLCIVILVNITASENGEGNIATMFDRFIEEEFSENDQLEGLEKSNFNADLNAVMAKSMNLIYSLNARACLRLRPACERLKKVLSANEFEQISIPIFERVKKPLEKVIAEAGLAVENIHSNECATNGEKEFFASMVVDTVIAIENEDMLNMIGIKKVPGGTMRDSFLVNGVAFKKTFSCVGFEQQPKKFVNLKILLLNIELELKSDKGKAELRLSDPSQYQSIVDAEWNIIYDKLDKCVKCAAKVVLSRLAIGDMAKYCDGILSTASSVWFLDTPIEEQQRFDHVICLISSSVDEVLSQGSLAIEAIEA
nr:T-complex protein 1 subunit eta [Ipomoea trifida]